MKRNGEPDSIPLQFFSQVDWDVCPSDLPCCNEYGYCRSRVCRCLLALIEDLSKTWQFVDYLELKSTQPLHAIEVASVINRRGLGALAVGL